MTTINKTEIAVVTGATGFIGYNLVKRLIHEGWDIHVIVRLSSLTSKLREISNQIYFHIYDDSVESLYKVFELANPSVVIHLAACSFSEHNTQDIAPMIKSNLIFATQLIDVMVANKVHQLINTGTAWQHYENKSYSPVCLYAATKQAFESILSFYCEATPLKVITLKLFDTYGAGDTRGKLFNILEKALNQQDILLMSQGEQEIDLVYIDDVIDAYMIAIDRLHENPMSSHKIFSVGSGNTISIRNLVSIYEREVGDKLNIIWGGRSARPREMMKPWSNGICIQGWQAKTSFQEGIRKIRQSNS